MSSTLKQLEFDRQLDLTLIRQFRKSGNIVLLGQVYSKYVPLIYGMSFKYLKNRSLSQDMVIKLFEMATIEVEKQEITNFRAWLYVATRSQCLAEISKQQADEGKSLSGTEQQETSLKNGFDLHPLDDLHQLSEALAACLQKLSKEQKTTIELFYFKKKCYREIAVAMNIDEKTVRQNIQNGKSSLMTCLENPNG
jgi:RNA polymerase sigma-70 factor, ECF subfamily